MTRRFLWILGAAILAVGATTAWVARPLVLGPPSGTDIQVGIFSAPGGLAPCGDTYDVIPHTTCPSWAGDVHLGSVFVNRIYWTNDVVRFQASFVVPPASTFCVRLFDVTRDGPVPHGEICRTNTDPAEAMAVRETTPAMGMPFTVNEFVVQAKGDPAGAVFDARMTGP